VARDQPLDAAPDDAPRARRGALDGEALVRARPVDAVLGDGLDDRSVFEPLFGDGRANRRAQVVDALAGGRGGHDDRERAAGQPATPLVGHALSLLGRHEVGLRQADQARQVRETGAVGEQLGLDLAVVVDRVGPVHRGQLDDVYEQPCPLDMGQKLVAEPGARARALDQPRDVGDHELAVVHLDRAEHGLDRRERVVGDLGLSVRHPREQGRLARVRKSYEPHVGQ
jgi:hypothetical protein